MSEQFKTGAGAGIDAAASTSAGRLASCSIVCERQAGVQLEGLLASLATGSPDLRIDLFDYAPTDTLRTLAQRFGAHYVHQPERPGSAHSHNLALRAAAQEGRRYHFVIDPGVQLPLDGVARLQAWMEQHPDTGLLAPRVQRANGQVWPLCRLLPHPLELLWLRCFPVLHLSSGRLARYQLHGSGYSREMEVPVLPACCLLLRVQTALRAGLFDERLSHGFGNADLARRIARGARVVFQPQVAIVHNGRADGASGRAHGRALVSALRYFNKWGWLRDEERDRINARALRASESARVGRGARIAARKDVLS